MTYQSEIKNPPKQDFSETAPVVHLVSAVDYILNELGVSEASFRTPSSQSDHIEKVAGLTNTYLHPTRISRKVVLGDVVFFYGQKFNLLPEIFETVSYDAPAEVQSFVENRIQKTLTDYMSIHKGNFRLNLDIKDGMITSLVKVGFDGQFDYLSKNERMTLGDLKKVIQGLLETS